MSAKKLSTIGRECVDSCCRVTSKGGVLTKASGHDDGDSHQYSQAAGPYWLAESIKVKTAQSWARALVQNRLLLCKVKALFQRNMGT